MYITSALPYINNVLHIGHIFEMFYAEYNSLIFNNFNFKILSGLDCHGLIKKTNLKKILKLNKTKIKYFNLNIDFNKTITLINKRICNWIYLFLNDKNYLFGILNKQLYNKKKKFFIPDKYVTYICYYCKSEIFNYCLICKKTKFLLKIKILKKNVIYKKTLNIYFKNYKYFIWNISRNKNYNGFIILSKKKMYFYVWFDALISYISNNLKFIKKKFLNKKLIQIIGKDIYYFHNIFKIILKIINFKNNKIYTHGFILILNNKISKSKNNNLQKKINVFYFKFYILLKIKNKENDIDLNLKEMSLFYKKFFFKKIINLYFRIRTIFKKYDNKLSEYFLLKKNHIELYSFYKLKMLNKIIKKKINECIILNKILEKNTLWNNKNLYLTQTKCTFLIKKIIKIINFFYFIINKNKIKKKILPNDNLFNIIKFYEN
ncbi:class I tRNA ligase family protein [Candidatus Carsonella ruddii]|uniref:Methionyl-tRNA synthetase n=1 Tax=Candidatus Carsonella ruddii PC isolate NHV TaxID=1202540 RepID=J3TWJ6_CARRU|nr:class I tRNA ligase family protein [Candidatus Carsonella ruddii]AFP84330.1 methionyl-tRNA synthetase [Candidatus Carsonella ruddii PC isolate NHV]